MRPIVVASAITARRAIGCIGRRLPSINGTRKRHHWRGKTTAIDRTMCRARSLATTSQNHVVPHYVAERDYRQRIAHFGPTVAGRGELQHQPFPVPTFDRIRARLLLIRKLDGQQPGLLAQLQRTVESARGNCRGGRLIHLSISFVAGFGRRRVRED